jgi:hypothetical protein
MTKPPTATSGAEPEPVSSAINSPTPRATAADAIPASAANPFRAETIRRARSGATLLAVTPTSLLRHGRTAKIERPAVTNR